MKNSPAAAPVAPSSRCPNCGADFACGMVSGEQTCWCAALPVVIPPNPAANSCLCPDCLRALPRRLVDGDPPAEQ